MAKVYNLNYNSRTQCWEVPGRLQRACNWWRVNRKEVGIWVLKIAAASISTAIAVRELR